MGFLLQVYRQEASFPHPSQGTRALGANHTMQQPKQEPEEGGVAVRIFGKGLQKKGERPQQKTFPAQRATAWQFCVPPRHSHAVPHTDPKTLSQSSVGKVLSLKGPHTHPPAAPGGVGEGN